jgi:hypothetical protein
MKFVQGKGFGTGANERRCQTSVGEDTVVKQGARNAGYNTGSSAISPDLCCGLNLSQMEWNLTRAQGCKTTPVSICSRYV